MTGWLSPNFMTVWLNIQLYFRSTDPGSTKLASGTTEELSKIWMSLNEFVKLVMPALLKGDNNVPIGMAVTVYEKYETGKSEFATQIGLGHKSKKKE